MKQSPIQVQTEQIKKGAEKSVQWQEKGCIYVEVKASRNTHENEKTKSCDPRKIWEGRQIQNILKSK